MNSFDEMVTDPRLRLDELLVHLEGLEGDGSTSASTAS